MNELKQLQRQINSNVNKIKLFSSTPYLVSKNKDQLYVLQTNVNNDLKKFKKDTKKYLESIFKTKEEDIQIPKSKKIKCMVKGTYFKDIKDLKLKSLSNTDINKLVENIDLSITPDDFTNPVKQLIMKRFINQKKNVSDQMKAIKENLKNNMQFLEIAEKNKNELYKVYKLNLIIQTNKVENKEHEYYINDTKVSSNNLMDLLLYV